MYEDLFPNWTLPSAYDNNPQAKTFYDRKLWGTPGHFDPGQRFAGSGGGYTPMLPGGMFSSSGGSQPGAPAGLFNPTETPKFGTGWTPMKRQAPANPMLNALFMSGSGRGRTR
jgi:hypothetical protein